MLDQVFTISLKTCCYFLFMYAIFSSAEHFLVTLGSHYQYCTVAETPLSDSLSVQNLSVHTQLLVHCKKRPGPRPILCTDNEARECTYNETPSCTHQRAPYYRYVPKTRPECTYIDSSISKVSANNFDLLCLIDLFQTNLKRVFVITCKLNF